MRSPLWNGTAKDAADGSLPPAFQTIVAPPAGSTAGWNDPCSTHGGGKRSVAMGWQVPAGASMGTASDPASGMDAGSGDLTLPHAAAATMRSDGARIGTKYFRRRTVRSSVSRLLTTACDVGAR